ncbi:hypothetical protein [Reinekea sp. G2M2-21]|uniref:hypothetical protein n=1 Tax=Reinekea sp. G2M2-21 TaxID=2788942 RepID=UPI0018AB7A64|nr:hypothetical protein [Reinekea sp. G2M2-21]
MKVKTLLLFVVFLVIYGCDKQFAELSPCGDLSSYPTEFDIINMSVHILEAQESKSYPGIILGEVYSEDSEVNFSDIVFSIDSEVQMIALKTGKRKSPLFSMISSAYACSPMMPSAKEKIVAVKISSSSAFNSSLAAGDSLVSKFDVVFADSATYFYSYEDSSVSYFSLERYLEQDEVYASYNMQLKLNESPEFEGQHIFFIEITLDSGEKFILETPVISFLTS